MGNNRYYGKVGIRTISVYADNVPDAKEKIYEHLYFNRDEVLSKYKSKEDFMRHVKVEKEKLVFT